jgi:hypothetical protein
MRRRKLLAVAGLTVLVAAGAFILWPRPDRITRENFDRIREGMNREEVYAILGPPGDYRTGPAKYERVILMNDDLDWTGEPIVRPGCVWISERALVDVQFVQGDCVTLSGLTMYCSGEKVSQGPLDNLFWGVKRQWRKWFPE